MVAVIKGTEVSDSALEVMQSYYDQLGCLETKIPFSQAKIYFKWLDAFDKGGWLGRLGVQWIQFCEYRTEYPV